MNRRKPFVGGNWKMNTNRRQAAALAQSIARTAADLPVQVAVMVPFPYLLTVADALNASSVQLGAQDVYHQPDGAFTGEVSLEMLKDCGVRVVLTGHSERRHVIGETDELINAKTIAILDAGLECILCVGEKLEQREAGQTDKVNETQVRAGLANVQPDQMARLTLAYEPVWAIGTGLTATPQDAQDAHAKIRGLIARLFTDEIAGNLRIQYGGSVKASNAGALFTQPDIDGGLIGGASLDSVGFGQIIGAAAASSPSPPA